MLMTVLRDVLWVVGITFAIVIIVFLAVVAWAYRIAQYGLKLQMELPWLTWLTLDNLVEKGYSRLYCQMLLPVFHERGYLEIRPRDLGAEFQESIKEVEKVLGTKFDIEEEALKFDPITETRFLYSTVHLFEFRLTKRGGRKKRFQWFRLPSFGQGWQPAAA